MSIIGILVTLIVVGVLLYVVETLLPIDTTIKRIIHILIILLVVVWLLQVFGLLGPLGTIRVQ